MRIRVLWALYALAMLGTAARAGEFSKQAVGAPGGWAGTIAGATLNGKLYTAETAGSLYATDPADGSWSKIGGADFAHTAFLFATGDSLVSIEKDGSLYLINPADGSWKRSGPAGEWAGTIAGAMLGGTLYTVEAGGALYATEMEAGAWTQAGTGFDGTAFLFAIAGRLCGIDADGQFFRAVEGGATAPAAAGAPIAAAPALSTAEAEAKNDPARAGALTFQFMGQWTGDTAPLEQDPEFLKQKAAAPEMVQQVVDLMRGMTMSVTLDGIAMQVMGETVGPFKYSVVAGYDNTLVIENDEGPKQGIRSRIVFADPKHLQAIEATPEGKAMFFKK